VDDRYAAGFLDGEGCIYIGDNSNATPSKRWRIFVTVSNKNEDVIKALRDKYGGSVHWHPDTRDNRYEMWVWSVVSRQAVNFLWKVAPYVIVKKPHVINALSFAQGFGEGGHRRNTKGHFIEPGELIMRKKHQEISKGLNAKRVPKNFVNNGTGRMCWQEVVYA